MFGYALRFMGALLSVSALLSAAPRIATAQQDAPDASQEMEDMLGGFDDEDGEGEVDEALAGFDDAEAVALEQPAAVSSSPAVVEDDFITISGSSALSLGYSFAHEAPEQGEIDYRGLSRARLFVRFELDVNLPAQWKAHVDGYGWYDGAYALRGEEDDTEELRDDRLSEIELGEAYLRGSLGQYVDVKFGRQVVVWGKSDNLRVTDIVNPLDFREPGLVDIEDLRLPVLATRLDFYVGDFSLTALAIHESRADKTPVWGSEFYPLEMPPPPVMGPKSGFAQTQYAMALNGVFSGWDFSLYGGWVLGHQPRVKLGAAGPVSKYDRHATFGAAGSVALGNWLLKVEAAHHEDLKMSFIEDRQWRRTDALVGLEYSGFPDTMLGFEIAGRHLYDYDDPRLFAVARQNEWQAALRYNADFLYSRLHAVFVLTIFGALEHSMGGFVRGSVAYDLDDALVLSGGGVFYLAGDLPPFNRAGSNHRIFAELKHSF